MTKTYKRHIETVSITKVHEPWAITMSDGWTFCPDEKYRPDLTVGTVADFEYILATQVVGIRVAGRWLYRKTDEDLEREHAEMVAGFRRERVAELERNRAKWEEQEAGLPDWVRARIQSFRETGGEEFELEGWGYELCIARLAVVYDEAGLNDDADSVSAFARAEGTSGNQHGMAKALARAHQEGQQLAGTVSALAPLTGKADYS